MEFKLNVAGSERKKLVAAISEVLGVDARYQKAPSFAYQIGDYSVDKHGTLTGEYNLRLMVALEERGFAPEASNTFHLITPRGTLLIRERFDTAEEAAAAGYGMYFTHEDRDVYIKPSGTSEHGKHFAVVGAPFEPTPASEPDAVPELDTLCIEMPLDGFTSESLENLTRLVTSKEALIKTALSADDLPIQMGDDTIRFPWFRTGLDGDTVAAYTQFIAALCDTAKRKKRVTAKAQDTYENERFTMRVWLIGLGMVGDEYKLARKILLASLVGNSAWRYGKPEKAKTPAEEE